MVKNFKDKISYFINETQDVRLFVLKVSFIMCFVIFISVILFLRYGCSILGNELELYIIIYTMICGICFILFNTIVTFALVYECYIDFKLKE